MSRKNLSPRYRQQDYRPKVYQQNSFKLGSYNDLPTTEVPSTATHLLYNTISRGSIVDSRMGTKRWGNPVENKTSARLPDYVFSKSIIMTTLAPDKTRQWIFNNWVLQQNAVGDYLTYYYNGKYISEKIISVDHNTGEGCFTETFNYDNITIANVNVGYPLGGIIYDDNSDRVFIAMGPDFYYCDGYYMESWNKLPFIGSLDSRPSYGITSFDIKNKTVYGFNSNGLYKVIADATTPYFIKTNTPIPTKRIEHVDADIDNPEMPADVFPSGVTPYARKRVYTMSRLLEPGSKQRNELDKPPIWETGGVSTDNDANIDFGIYWSEFECSPEHPHDNITLYPAENSNQATHYSLYGTFNIERQEGIKEDGNNPEELIWELDIPVLNVFETTIFQEPGPDTYVLKLANSGIFPNYISDYDLNTDYKIINTDPALSGVIGPINYNITGIDRGTNHIDISTTYDLGNVGDTVFITMGVENTGVVNIYNDVITFTSMSHPPIEGDTIYIDTYPVTLTETLQYGPTEFIFKFTSPLNNFSDGIYNVAYNLAPRNVQSILTDSDLRARQEVRPMLMRFWTPIQNGALGVVHSAFCFIAQQDEVRLEYSQLSKGFEYLIGYHNKSFQFDELEDTISEISKFSTFVSVKCKTSTVSIPITKYTRSGYPSVGRFVYVLDMTTTVSNSIGSTGVGSSAKILGEDIEMVITNEPGLRIFDGNKYSENLFSEKLMTKLKLLISNYSTTYASDLGFVVFGRQE